jgi:hypothetical protein
MITAEFKENDYVADRRVIDLFRHRASADSGSDVGRGTASLAASVCAAGGLGVRLGGSRLRVARLASRSCRRVLTLRSADPIRPDPCIGSEIEYVDLSLHSVKGVIANQLLPA